MGKTLEAITADLQEFIEAQPLFFVATAPLSAAGHVNLSPKGLDCLRVLGPYQVAYLDLTGSGNETAAHLVENGRITMMFCAFGGRPKIVRLHGCGRSILPDMAEWLGLRRRFPEYPGVRQIIVVEVTRVSTSCGFGVPLMEYVGQRENLPEWERGKGEERLVDYRAEKNSVSIDGLPAPLSGADIEQR